MPPHEDDGARVPPPRPSRSHQPSFSAALLDAMYHSLEADAEARSSTEARRTRTRTRTPASSASSSPARRTPLPGRRCTTPEQSPSCSSVRSPRLQRTPRPWRVRPDPQQNPNGSLFLPPPLPPPHESSTGDCRATDAEKKSGRGRKKSKRTTAKAAPFACLLNALLCNRRPARARARSVDHTPRATAAASFAVAPEPASARSILASRASRREASATGGGILTPARRAVRFSPVATVVDDEHGHGHGHGVIGTASTGLRHPGAEMARAKESAAEAERKVEELLRALGVADERERAKESSESSSDLFELESLPALQDRDTEMPRSRTAACDGGGLLARPRPRVSV